MYPTIKKSFSCLCAAMLLSGCSITGSSTPGSSSPIAELFQPTKVPLSFKITSSPNQNPDQTGRPSPLQVRIYQLADETLFKNADFYSLFDKDTEVLGNSLKKRQILTVNPGQRAQSQSIVLGRKTMFIGILGAFRDIDDSVSKLLIPVDPQDPIAMCLRIEEKSLVLKTGSSC